MFLKTAFAPLNDLEALNNPNLPDFVLDQKLSIDLANFSKIALASKSTASKDIDGEADSEFNLEAEIKEHPDSLYIKCFAIKADEMNDNGDYFPKAELKKAYQTFVGVPIFTNHQNTDINQARGKIVHAWWDEDKNGIMVIGRVDAVAYPQLARGIKEKYMVSSSMGCRVVGSACSICHNYSEDPSGYCTHIKEQKTRKISAKKQKCEYHKNGKDDKCPVCGSTKDDIKTFAVNEEKAFEYNYGIHFIENSIVSTPACHSCGITEVIDPEKFLSKVSDIEARLPSLLKAKQAYLNAKNTDEVVVSCNKQQCTKTAGQDELNKLNQALDLISEVSRSMLDQKNQIDLEFLSDLVKVLADLQATTDELTEQGYGRLQSAPDSQNSQQQVNPMSPEDAVTKSVQPTGQTQPQQPQMQQNGRVQSGSAGAAGTVTSPATASVKRLKLEKVSKLSNRPTALSIKIAKIIKKHIKTAQVNTPKQSSKLSLPPLNIKKRKKNIPN